MLKVSHGGKFQTFAALKVKVIGWYLLLIYLGRP